MKVELARLADWTICRTDHGSQWGEWEHAQALPPARLRGAVRHMWAVRGWSAVTREAILPTGGVELMMTLGPRHAVLGEPATGSDVDCRRSWLSGPQVSPLTVDSPQGTDLVGVALTPLGAHALLGLPMNEVAGRVVDLSQLLSHAAEEARERMDEAPDLAGRLGVLARLVEAGLARGAAAHPDARAASTAIVQSGGTVRIADLCASLGVSHKLLVRRFREAVGMTPKAYAQVIRFQRVIETVRDRLEVDWAELAQETGFFDQPHFSNGFRAFAGCSPGEYLRLRTPDGGSVRL